MISCVVDLKPLHRWSKVGHQFAERVQLGRETPIDQQFDLPRIPVRPEIARRAADFLWLSCNRNQLVAETEADSLRSQVWA